MPRQLETAVYVYMHGTVMVCLCEYHNFNCRLMPHNERADSTGQFFSCSFCRVDVLEELGLDHE